MSPEIGKEEEEETNGVEEADSTSQPGQATDAQVKHSLRYDRLVLCIVVLNRDGHGT